jgi:outer membrane receptor protein involved in Fe transport
MANKNCTWLGLLAILTIGPGLVAHAQTTYPQEPRRPHVEQPMWVPCHPDVGGRDGKHTDGGNDVPTTRDHAASPMAGEPEPTASSAPSSSAHGLYQPLAIYPEPTYYVVPGAWRMEQTYAAWPDQPVDSRPPEQPGSLQETDEPAVMRSPASAATERDETPVCLLGPPQVSNEPTNVRAPGRGDPPPPKAEPALVGVATSEGYLPLAKYPVGVTWSMESTFAPVFTDRAELTLVAQEKGGDEKKQPAPKQPQQPETPQAQPQTQPQTPQTQPGQAPGSLESFLGLPSVAGGAAAATAAQAQAPAAAATNISGQSAVPASGVGDLLASSNSAQGVEVQRRSPLVGDPRVEGLHFGQIFTQADGGYWFPARVDLDSVVSKLNTSDIQNILVVRGPFSVRYGPAFSFIDIESLPTPRSTLGCFDAHGSTSINYRSNGQAIQGQQSFWGGNTNWGFRLTYDINTASDYESGDGRKLPSSYNNQFANFAFGFDLSRTESVELRYLHVDQNNVLFPGLLTDINNLATDAVTARYTAKEGHWFDRLTIDGWVNQTSFNGDSANPQTRAQIPALDNIFPAYLSPANAALDTTFGPVRLDINTNGNALSYGAREIVTWGDVKSFNVSVGADIRVFVNNYNEFDAFNLSVLPGTGLPANLGIPNARQVDGGAFVDTSMPVGERLVVKAGVRGDYLLSDFLNFGVNVNQADYITQVGEPINRRFFLFSGYLTGEYKLTQEWSLQTGYGYAQRPPTLTEFFAGGSFLGLIQNGLNSIYGNPDLLREQMHQGNLGVTGKYDQLRVGGNTFYAFVPSYITYDNLGAFTVSNITVPGLPPFTGTTPINRLRFINTRLATLYGFDAYGEWDALPWLTPFATLSFVEGWDQTHDEALPGIPPLSSRVGMRLHEPGKTPRWGVEYTARLVATQDLFAASLGEQRTGGFVVHYLRAYWQPRRELLILAGIENIGNLQYREHLDLRTGLGVFQPGINFYVGTKVTY